MPKCKLFLLLYIALLITACSNESRNTNKHDAAPILTSILPAAGLTIDKKAKISGSNLQNATVTLNGIVIIPLLKNAHAIELMPPDLPSGVYTLELKNGVGSTRQQISYLGNEPQIPLLVNSISSGQQYTCATVPGGKIYCWGSNYSGQLGNDSIEHANLPVAVNGINNATTVSAGEDHACAVQNTGQVMCWGSNSYGQLGNNSTTNSHAPVTVANVEQAIAVSAGEEHSCALLSDHTITCWGKNDFGQLGNNSMLDSSLPVTVHGINTAIAISVGNAHTCALLADSTLQCWGVNFYGQLGNDDAVASYLSPVPIAVTGINTAIAVSAGDSNTCAVLADSSLQCWGINDHAQLGNFSSPISYNPVTISGIHGVTGVNLGKSISSGICASIANGTVQCWGPNLDTGDIATPATITNLSSVVSVTVGGAFQCALLTNSTVKCWGYDFFGQLGNNPFLGDVFYKLPVTIAGVTSAKAISNDRHICTVSNSGTLQCWGSNVYGQLGNNSTIASDTPVNVSNIDSALSVSVSREHSCALLDNGTVQCWGYNGHGQLGDGTTDQQLIPATVTDLSNAIAVSIGHRHSCALLATGTVQCWGDNDNGQLGNGTETNSTQPVTVNNINTAIAISSGPGNTCALLANGSVQCWGMGFEPFSFEPSPAPRHILSPETVSGINTATAIDVGAGHACALLTDATIQCWGQNAYGQLGYNSTTDSLTPVVVNGIHNAIKISAGYGHTCALLANGNVQCWGMNNTGQLGNNSRIESLLPVTVPNLLGAVDISAGFQQSCALLRDGYLQCWGLYEHDFDVFQYYPEPDKPVYAP